MRGCSTLMGTARCLPRNSPAVVHYDPAYGYEIAHIVQDGLRRMYGEGQSGDSSNLIYYLTVYNEPIVQPVEPDNVDVEGILKGMYKLSAAQTEAGSTRRRAPSCSPPASVCRGRSRHSSCSPTTGASRPTCGP